MKVTGPGSGLPPEATGEGGGVERAGGKGFAEKLDKSSTVSGAGPAAATPATGPATPVSDIGAALKAGQITPQTAVDQVVGRVLDQQLGPNAPAAVRAKVETALRDALESDPLLAEKLKSLSR